MGPVFPMQMTHNFAMQQRGLPAFGVLIAAGYKVMVWMLKSQDAAVAKRCRDSGGTHGHRY
jgi:hypothetical protein